MTGASGQRKAPADAVKRSNCSNIMPTKRSMMTRGAAWNVIRERNWVQQTIADRDKRWCPTDIAKKLSPADRVGAIDPAQFGKMLNNVDDLTWACADSGLHADYLHPRDTTEEPSTDDEAAQIEDGRWKLY